MSIIPNPQPTKPKKRFVGHRHDLPRGICRIADDPTRRLEPAIVERCYRRGWLTDWERDFLLSTFRIPRYPNACSAGLTARQMAKRREINLKILAAADALPYGAWWEEEVADA